VKIAARVDNVRRRAVEKGLGQLLDEVSAEFTDEPMAAAAQVNSGSECQTTGLS
jgi:hypothetical protein